MAYTFPPRGFPQQENSPQIPPNSGRPPFPPCPPPRHMFHGTPMGSPTGHDMPSFGRENLQFGPPPSPFMRFPNSHAFRPPPIQQGGAWLGGAGPGRPPRQFAPRMGQVRPYRPRTQYNQFNNSPAFTSDITAYESWPASSCQPGRNGRQGGQEGPSHPRTGQRSKTNQQNNSKGGEFSNQKKQKNRRFKKKGPSTSQKGQGNAAAQGLDDCPHYCDVCDRGFKAKELLDDHLKQHAKCSHPGCRFEAHFKVIKSHIKMQHGPGSKKVAWLDTSEEISRWRDERRRNYPSAVNIAKKEEMSRSNKEQGVALQNKYFGKMRQHQQGKHQLKGQTGDHGTDAKRRRINVTAHPDSIDDSSGTKHGVQTTSTKLTQGSLSALAVAYDESEDEETELQQATQMTAVEGHLENASTSRPTNTQVRFHNPNRQRNKGNNRKTHRGTRAGKHVKEKQRRQEELKRRPNLLEMLLAPDIRRERNIILQCVRYVVQNNFFEIGAPNATRTTESSGVISNPRPENVAVEDGLSTVAETTGTGQEDSDARDECEAQVRVVTPEEADDQTSSESKDAVTTEEKSLASQETLDGIKDETPIATNGDIPVGLGGEGCGNAENDGGKSIEIPQAESDTNELQCKEPLVNLVVPKDESDTNKLQCKEPLINLVVPKDESDTNKLQCKEPLINLVVPKDESDTNKLQCKEPLVNLVVPKDESDTNELQYKEPLINLVVPKDESDTNELQCKEPLVNLVVPKGTEDKVTSGPGREVDDGQNDKTSTE